MAELTEAMGGAQPLMFAGREWSVKPLNFNALIKIEQRFGSLEEIDMTKLASLLFLVWVALSSADPGLTEEQVGEMMSLDKINEVTEFIGKVFDMSGVNDSVKNAPAARARKTK